MKKPAKPSVRRVVLSAIKAFAVSSIVVLAGTDLTNVHGVSDLRALGLAVLIGGGDAALKVLQIALEETP